MSASQVDDEDRDAGPPGGRTRQVERTCIVTRTVRAPDRLIRFVASPDGEAVADLKAVLPGRGCWVTASRGHVAKAARKGAFARALKAPAGADADRICALIEAQLRRNALSALGMARKAGQLVSGFAKVEAALKSGRARVLIAAGDGAADGKGKLARIASAAAPGAVQIDGPYPAQDLGLALGLENVIHAALFAGAAADSFLRSHERYLRFLDDAWTNEVAVDGSQAPGAGQDNASDGNEGLGPKDDVTTE